jgi:hypothetical protein
MPMQASFNPGNIASGATTELIVTYTSATAATLFLNGWDPAEFTIEPDRFPLPAAPAGRTTPPPSLRVRITRHAASTSCGVHVVLDSVDDTFAFVEVA